MPRDSLPLQITYISFDTQIRARQSSISQVNKQYSPCSRRRIFGHSRARTVASPLHLPPRPQDLRLRRRPSPNDGRGLREGSSGPGRRANADSGADGQVGEHQRTSGQRQRLVQQVPEHVSPEFEAQVEITPRVKRDNYMYLSLWLLFCILSLFVTACLFLQCLPTISFLMIWFTSFSSAPHLDRRQKRQEGEDPAGGASHLS